MSLEQAPFRLWAEVWDAAGENMLGVVNLQSAQISRMLDGAAEITLTAPATDANAVDHLAIWRQARIYTHDGRAKRLRGTCILLQKQLSVGAGPMLVMWSGLDQLAELRRKSTYRGLTYSDETIERVARDLVLRVDGWRVQVDAGLGSTSRRFDAESLLGALLDTVTGIGAHVRLAGDRLVQVGAFGDDCGVRITNARAAARELNHNPDVALIERLEIMDGGHDLVNVMEPVWGAGDAVLTLKRSTRSSPYTVEAITTPAGRTAYVLKDAASIATYGEVEGVAVMQSTPYLAAGEAVNAANVLYDWAASRLARVSVPQQTFRVSGVKLARDVLPGDKIRLAYKGFVYQRGVKVDYADVDALFWVMSVTERYDGRGLSFDWEISNVDALPVSADEMVAASVLALETAGIRQSLTANVVSASGSGTLDRDHPLSVTVTVSDTAVDIGRAAVTVTRASSAGPYVVSVRVGSVEAAGGPFMWDASADDTFTVEIDDLLTGGTITGDHTITVACLYGSGDVDVNVSVTEVGVSVV